MNKHHFHKHTVYVKYILLCLSKSAMPHGVCNHTFAQMHKQQKKNFRLAWWGLTYNWINPCVNSAYVHILTLALGFFPYHTWFLFLSSFLLRLFGGQLDISQFINGDRSLFWQLNSTRVYFLHLDTYTHKNNPPIRGTESDVAGMISATRSMKTVSERSTVMPWTETNIKVTSV